VSGVRPRGPALDQALDELLATWEREPPDGRPIDVRSVAKALPASPTSLYKEAADPNTYPEELRLRQARIRAAARRQAENAAFTPGAVRARKRKDDVARLMEERDKYKAAYAALLQRLAGMEYHARMLGYDAERLWRPLPSNDRETRGRSTMKRRAKGTVRILDARSNDATRDGPDEDTQRDA